VDAAIKPQGALERWVAAAAFATPLYYLVTERTRDPFLFGWSKTWVAMIVGYSAFYAALLATYSRPWPKLVRTLRSLVVASWTTLIVVLVGAELVLRAQDHPRYEEIDNTGRHAPDPDVGHIYVPNHTQVLQSREFRSTWSSNAQGVRSNRDFGPKAPGVIRVLCVGDSFTACDQVDYEQSWPAVLEACLRSRYGASRIEVVNAGFPGYATVNEARWIAKFGAAFEPDVVLLAMTPNDLLENLQPLQYTAVDGAMVSSESNEQDKLRFERRRKWWCLAGVINRSLLLQRLDRSPAYRRLLGRRPINHVEAYMVKRDEKAERVYAVAEGYLLEAKANAAALGAAFAVIVIPYSHQLHPLGPGLDPTRFGRAWTEFGATHGIPVADALPNFMAQPDPSKLHWKEDSHCNAEGYAIVAQTACELLINRRSELRLPEPSEEQER